MVSPRQRPLHVEAGVSVPPTTEERREWGKLGARRRWGAQRVVRLDRVDPDTARLIRALLAQNDAAEESAA